MASIKQIIPVIALLVVALITLPISAHESQLITLIGNVKNQNLTAALSTLNMYYFMGLSATLASFVLSLIRYRSNALTIIRAFIIMYFVGYPLLFTLYPLIFKNSNSFRACSLSSLAKLSRAFELPGIGIIHLLNPYVYS